MNAKYVIDTNVILDDPSSLETLRNGSENEIYIPYSVLCELDRLKTSNRIRSVVHIASEYLGRYMDWIKILRSPTIDYSKKMDTDETIIREIVSSGIPDLILISNDNLLRLKAKDYNIMAQPFNASQPFKSESEIWTGFSTEEEPVPNSFYWKDGKPVYFKSPSNIKVIGYQNSLWKIIPKNIYQNLAFELLLDNSLDIVTLQGNSGYGKTFLILAAAFYHVLQDKKSKYKKIFILKSPVEIGKELGYRPGDIDRKMAPIIRPIVDLILKLHNIRNANRLFLSAENHSFNHDKIEIIPLNFIRGMNIENSILIIDEAQNLSRLETRSILSRCGNDVRAFICGDINQIDNPYLNRFNNGLNWIVKLFKGESNYGHLVLKGEKSRGPITDSVIKIGL